MNGGPKSFNEYFVFNSLPNLQAAGAQMWTVQIVTPNAGPVQAVGCEANVTVKFNETRTLNVLVNDLPLL
ncbi:MAG TPA: hypothetical protein EYN66_14230, partial [Myxococcales bacterium]|nr:hypothetical protein [Myxococcales bacterium]